MLGDAFFTVSWEPNATVLRADLQAKFKAATAGLDPKVRVGADVDTQGIAAALAALQARLKTLTGGRQALADLVDINVPQGQLIGQLLLLRRLVQQSGLSDMLGVNLNDAEIRTQLDKIARLSTDISVGANTAGASSAVAALAARIDTLSGTLAGLRIGADTKPAEAAVAALQARLAGLVKQHSKLVLSADTSKLDAQIAAEQAKLAALRQSVSRVQVDADTTAAQAKIAALQKQIADWYKRLEKLEKTGVDLDINAALTKIYALEAQLRVLQDRATRAIRLKADTAAINAAITATETRILDLTAEAARIKLGGNIDVAGLATTDARILALEAATGKLQKTMAAAAVASAAAGSGAAAAGTAAAKSGQDAGQAGGLWAGLGRVFATTGVGWAATIGGVAGWHIVLDLAIEAAISLGTAMLALGAAAVAVYPAIDQLSYGINNILKVSGAFGASIGPLGDTLSKLQKSVVPQVYEAFGGALQLATGQAGALARTAHDVVNMIDTWIAKIDIWAGRQGGINGLMHTGTGYLAQFGKFFGILGDAISNLLRKDPGIARYLLDILQGLAGLLDIFSKLPGPVVEAVLALHGLYLWGSVFLGVIGRLAGPFTSLIGWISRLGVAGEETAAVGGLAAVLGKAATSAKAFGAGLLAIADNPLTWAVIAAAGVAYLAYQLTQASSGAQNFISATDQWLSQLSASQAATQGIAYAIGSVRSQISATQAANGNLIIGLGDTASASGNAFKSLLHDAPLSNQMFKDLASGVTNAVKAFFGWSSIGPQIKKNGNDVSAFTGDIVKLTGQQTTLYQIMSHLVRGTNDLGIGALSAGNALGLMDIAGVKVGDSFAVAWQKIANLVAGYKAMSIQSGILANSINALDFATAQQDSHVTELNSAWDTFFKTVSGGETDFASFASQSAGLYQSLGQVADQVRVSSGRVSISLGQSGKAATTTTASITGLNTASIQARQTFLQTAGAANTQLDSLTLLASAAGLGSKGTDMLTSATKDMLAEMLPAAKGSQAMTTILYALAQRGGYQGADSFRSLAHWVGNTKDPMASLDGIVTTLTTDAGSLTNDVKNLSIALGQNLTDAMSKAILQATGGQVAFDALATDIMHSGTNSSKTTGDALALAQQIVNLTGNTKDAHDQFVTFVTEMTHNRAEAELLWSEIAGKLTPAIHDQATNVIPSVTTAFENWAKDGLNKGKSAADDLWNELTSKLGPQLNGPLAQAVLGSQAKFEAWAGKGGASGFGLTKSQADALYNELKTLQAFIDTMHGTAIAIKMTGLGQYTISAIAAGGQQLGAGTAPARAAGGYISMGSGPTADDVLIRGSRGEYMIRAAAVAKYGVGMMNAINAGTFAGGGLIPRYAAGGPVMAGNLTPGYLAGMQATFQTSMQAAMITSMRNSLKAAENAAARAAAAAAITGTAGGGAAQWAGVVRQVLGLTGLPAADAGTILAQINTESGGNPAAVNRTDSNWAAGHPCVPLSSLIFTDRGWLACDQVHPGDRTPGWNAGTGQVEWTLILQVRQYGASPLVRLEAGEWSAVCTPNHRWLLDDGGFVEARDVGPGHKLRLDTLAPVTGVTVTGAGMAEVWCVTTSLGTWTMRQDGRVMLTGNSVGLLQVIAGTYQTYGSKKFGYPPPVVYGVSENPLANIYAGVNYAINTYGNPGFLSVLGHGHGYALGGPVPGFASGGLIGKDQAAELAAYYAFATAFAKSLPGAPAGSWLKGHRTGIAGELRTLAGRQSAEEAAYDAVVRSAGASSRVSHFGTMLRDLTTTLGDQDLSYAKTGGQPGRRHTLLSWIAALERLKYPGALAGASVPGSGGQGGVSGVPVPVLGSYFKNTAAMRSALATAQRGERAKYFGLEHSFDIGLAKAKKGSWLYSNRTRLRSELHTLAARQQSELAAYAALTGAGLTPANLTRLGSAARAETSTAQDQLFSAKALPGNMGGHPLWDRALRQYLAQIISIAKLSPPGAPGSQGAPGTGPGGLGVLPPVAHIYGGDVVTGTIARILAQAAAPFGGARGGLVMDRGGWLAPGPNVAWNLTGHREHLVPDHGGELHIHLHVHGPVGSQPELENWLTTSIRKVVKTRGAGSVERAFGAR